MNVKKTTLLWPFLLRRNGDAANHAFDILPTSYKVNDVSFTLLGATFKNKLKEDFEIPKDLISIGLLTDDGLVTNGGLLLCDQGVLAQSRIFCTRWRGKYKGDVDEDALDDKEFKDSSFLICLQGCILWTVGEVE